MRRLLITGSGMVASALAQLASQYRAEAHICPHELLDVTNREDALAVVRRVRPQVVIHTAALTRVNYCEENEAEAFAVNEDGTANLVQAAALVETELVYLSTDYVIDGTKRSPWVESDPPGPKNAYGRSKLAGEEVVRAYSRGHIVRTSGVFGGRLDAKPERNFFRGIAERLKEAPETDRVPVIGDHYTAVTYAPHLAEMLFELMGTGLPPAVHLVSQGSDSWYGWAKLAARQLGVDEGRLKAVSAAELGDSTPRPAFSVLGTELARAARLIENHPASAGVAAYMHSLLARKPDRQLA